MMLDARCCTHPCGVWGAVGRKLSVPPPPTHTRVPPPVVPPPCQCLPEFPFFHTVYRIAFESADAHSITELASPVPTAGKL